MFPYVKITLPKKTSGAWEVTRSARCRTSPGVPCSSSSTSGSTSSSSCLSSLLPTRASSLISCWTGESDSFWFYLLGEDKLQLKCWKDANFYNRPEESIGYVANAPECQLQIVFEFEEMPILMKCQSLIEYMLLIAPECQLQLVLQCFAFQEQDKGIVRECLCWSSESSNIVSRNFS